MLQALVVLLAACAFALSAGGAVAAEKRVALVVGNWTYSSIEALVTPRNDGEAVGSFLEQIGFEVIPAINASKRDLDQLAGQFRAAVRGADVGVFFFSGHGFQTSRVNQHHPVSHVVPVDFNLQNPEATTFALDTIIEILRDVPVAIVIVDACRSDPRLVESEKAAKARAVKLSRAVRPAADSVTTSKRKGGLLLAYSAEPGKDAFDGDGPLSPFTTALVKHMRTPGLRMPDLMGKVSDEVRSGSEGAQEPWHTANGRAVVEYQLVPPAKSIPQFQ
jgi:uncharacterized caspase-like protein